MENKLAIVAQPDDRDPERTLITDRTRGSNSSHEGEGGFATHRKASHAAPVLQTPSFAKPVDRDPERDGLGLSQSNFGQLPGRLVLGQKGKLNASPSADFLGHLRKGNVPEIERTMVGSVRSEPSIFGGVIAFERTSASCAHGPHEEPAVSRPSFSMQSRPRSLRNGSPTFRLGRGGVAGDG